MTIETGGTYGGVSGTSERGIGALIDQAGETSRRLLIIRLTHWLAVLGVFGLLVSGVGILISHPRLYWGETGGIGTDSLIDLPIPFIIGTYNAVQQLTYLVVVFVLFPAIIWTGLAMSFGVTSVLPTLVTALGGHQSARTLHFVFASLLVVFVIVHIVMLCLVGFNRHMRAMITGYIPREGNAG